MVDIPQVSYRNKRISFEQFSDILIIGMMGLTDHLMEADAQPYIIDGMVNYNRVAHNLGLRHEDDWIKNFGYSLENHGQMLVSHDSAPEEIAKNQDDGCWVYLNSGFERIAELLYEKYYIQKTSSNMSYEEFQDIFLVEIAGLVENRIDAPDEGDFQNKYDLKAVVDFCNLDCSDEWISRFIGYAVFNGFLTEVENEEHKYSLTQAGRTEAQRVANAMGEVEYLLSTQGKSELYFSVDASHINRLGQELVAKQETAVAELVKNGYDADARRVELIFKSIDKLGGTLEVFDDGLGMSYKTLVDDFMTISTNDKVTNPLSKTYKRQKAGRKGIGRFAAQRLGKKLTLLTTTKDSDYALKLSINWDDFEARKQIFEIPNRIERVKKDFKTGTKLIIESLRDTWSESQIQRSYKHISEIIQPFPLSPKSDDGADPGFEATFAVEENNDLQIVADDWKMFFKDALAVIEGRVDKEGHGFWKIASEKYEILEEEKPIGPDKNDPSKSFSSLQNVRFRAYYYIDKELPRTSAKRVRDKLQESGGIRLYRNGFRVLPYGERYDDWLKLNASNLMRKILPPHSNRNFLGFVEIEDVDGKQFEETSSREGLLENKSFSELKDFVSSSIKSAVFPIAEARNKRKTTTDTRRERRTIAGRAQEIIEKLEALKIDASDKPEHLDALNSVFSSIGPSIAELKDQEEIQIEEMGMMRVLGSLGLTIGEFTHEIEFGFERLTMQAQDIYNHAGSNSHSKEAIKSLLEKLEDIKSYLTYFDRTARENVYREIQPIEIRDAVHSFHDLIKPKLDRNELEVSVHIDGYSLFTKPMHKSEWASILINFFTNALKAIKRTDVKGRIRINAGRENGFIFLEFSDNGDGIPEQNRERVFDAFFTTTYRGGTISAEEDEVMGMGLGLKIVKDIIEAANGSVEIIDAQEGYSTCIRVEVPEAKDLPDDAY